MHHNVNKSNGLELSKVFAKDERYKLKPPPVWKQRVKKFVRKSRRNPFVFLESNSSDFISTIFHEAKFLEIVIVGLSNYYLGQLVLRYFQKLLDSSDNELFREELMNTFEVFHREFHGRWRCAPARSRYKVQGFLSNSMHLLSPVREEYISSQLSRFLRRYDYWDTIDYKSIFNLFRYEN